MGKQTTPPPRMSFLFGRRPRTNTVDLPKQAKEQMLKLDGPAGAAKAEELAKTLGQMKFVLQGTQETESSPEQVYSLVTGMIQEDPTLSSRRKPMATTLRIEEGYTGHLLIRPPISSSNVLSKERPTRTQLCDKQPTRSFGGTL